MSRARDAKIHLDDSELRTLAVDLSGAPLRVQFNGREALKKGARLIAAGMREDASGHRFLSKLPASVSWEIKDRFTAEIGLGPKPGTQGSLAHIIAYGSVNNAPVYDHTAALRRSERQVVEFFANAAEESVLGQDKS